MMNVGHWRVIDPDFMMELLAMILVQARALGMSLDKISFSRLAKPLIEDPDLRRDVLLHCLRIFSEGEMDNPEDPGDVVMSISYQKAVRSTGRAVLRNQCQVGSCNCLEKLNYCMV